MVRLTNSASVGWEVREAREKIHTLAVYSTEFRELARPSAAQFSRIPSQPNNRLWIIP